MTPPPALPTFWELEAPAEWTVIDFISDLHLSPETPRTFEVWADYLRSTPASAVIILGDLFEVWIGDDSRHTGFEARCTEVLADAASHRALGFACGNRDFLVGGEMLRECGIIALPDPTVLVAFGERVMLSHGDSLCIDDREYQQFRAMVRSEAWQREFLARPLAQRRDIARTLRDHSEQRKRAMAAHEWSDIDKATAVRWMHEANTPTLIHGHTHRPAHEVLAPGYMREVLSDWDCDDIDAPPRAEALRLRGGGLVRVPLVR
jgi:UDP-2,3-diacylglucosamine hydrolase